jgi:hypothetical protein
MFWISHSYFKETLGYSQDDRKILLDSLTNYLSPWNKSLSEKLTDPELLKKFTTLYEIRCFFTAFTKSRHLCLDFRKEQVILLVPKRFTLSGATQSYI